MHGTCFKPQKPAKQRLLILTEFGLPPAPICIPGGALEPCRASSFEIITLSASRTASRVPPPISPSAVAASPSDAVVPCPCASLFAAPSTSRRPCAPRRLRLGSPECGALTASVTFVAQAAKTATLCTRLGCASHCRAQSTYSWIAVACGMRASGNPSQSAHVAACCSGSGFQCPCCA